MAQAKCDFFISYSHADKAWVLEHLYAPLEGCEYSTGAHPAVFIDGKKDNDNIPLGSLWRDELEVRIKACKVFVAVVSSSYLSSRYCMLELGWFNPRLIAEEPDCLLLLIRIDPHVTLPTWLSEYQRSSPDVDDGGEWFRRVCTSLKVKPRAAKLTARFCGPVPDKGVGLTLDPVDVEVLSNGARPDREFTVTLTASTGELTGGSARETKGGVATFSSLKLDTAATGVRLVAAVPGAAPVQSNPFNVLLPPPPPPVTTPPTIPVEGEAVFFASGKAVLVARPGAVGVYDLAGRPLLAGAPEIAFPGRLRLVRRAGPLLALADWAGNVFLFDDAGWHKSWAFGHGFVPGDVAFDGDTLYAGFWSGQVFRVSRTDPPKEVLRHPDGVQALAVAQGRCHVADFGGTLAGYDGAKLVNSATLERAVWLLRPAGPDTLFAVGDKAAYQVQTRGYVVFPMALPVEGVSHVLADTGCPVVMTDRGHGVRVNAALTFRQRILADPRAVAASADDAGRLCVLANPDGSRALLYEERVVLNHAAGTLAVSGGADWFAVGEPGGVRVLTAAGFKKQHPGAIP